MRFLLFFIAATALFANAMAQDKVLNGDANCTRCHDENDSFPVLAIGKTKHGTRADQQGEAECDEGFHRSLISRGPGPSGSACAMPKWQSMQVVPVALALA